MHQELSNATQQDINALLREWRCAHSHPRGLIISNPSHGFKTRSSLRNICHHLSFISQIESKSITEVEKYYN